MRLLPILAVALSVCRVQAKAVFAHFMVGNVPTWDVATWQADIRVAQAARIDAFALNIAFGDPNNLATLSRAFQAANILGFKLFFSFDYAGDVTSLILQYRANGAYYQYNGKPFVSTFEGPESAPQWAAIKSATNCFFIPDWSSQGAAVAMTLGNADGLFNWAAWPYGQNDMYTVIDASYRNFLGGKPYMMAVSPWFYTNLPGYDKNWMWKGDNLWFDRWSQVQVFQPEFVQIISWNDFGESHYIGPLHDDSYGAFETGRAPFNYVKGMPHDGWRVFLPFLISTYKNNISSIAQEALSVWYRVNPTTSGCSFGGTTGNTLSQQQCESSPADLVRDRVHYTALLSSPSSVVTVTIGGVASTGTWRNIPDGGIGLYQGNAFFDGRTGAVVVTVRSPAGTTTVNGAPITNVCPNGNLQNWNAWTGSAIGPTNPATPPRRTEQQQCIAGTGRPPPPSLGKPGYPIATMDHKYDGLCDFACDHGYCPSTACSYVKVTLNPPNTQSPFPVCWGQVRTAGHGTGNLAGLCSMACGYGHCPQPCTCDSTGNQVPPPATAGQTGCPVVGIANYSDYLDLCAWTCSHGYCPPGACTPKPVGTVCSNQ
ncbi:glycosyl hydrolase family 71-domain-containing protein [Leptodontidium sp. MPI-SDFR-AT-0119]|nr:glycosyl hydrolase family 71-domain-containing protein [Leptodontidium sp. MPI-SDFR-AT-0119]